MPKNNFQGFGRNRGITVTEANEGQRQFWNDKPGANWVRFYRDLDTMHQSVLVKLLECAAPEAGETVIDIGCGAGTSSFALGDLVGPMGAAAGYDISEPLLAKAEERRAEKGASNVSFHLQDAQTAAFDGTADLVVSRFGVMFFDDPEGAFANLHSALRPGGRIVFITWAESKFNPWFSLARKIAVERSKREIKPALRVLEGVKNFDETDESPEALKFKMKTQELHDFVNKADTMLEKIVNQKENWITKTIMKLMT